jgi:hypothetical protein
MSNNKESRLKFPMNPFGLTPQQIAKYVVSVKRSPASSLSKWHSNNIASGLTAQGRKRRRPYQKRNNAPSLTGVVRELLTENPNLKALDIFDRIRDRFPNANPQWLKNSIRQRLTVLRKEMASS